MSSRVCCSSISLQNLLEFVAAVDLRGVLQLGDDVGIEDVGFALAAPLILAADVEIERFAALRARIGVFVAAQRFLGNLLQPDALDAAGRAGEILVDESGVQPDRFENLRAAVALLRRDAHLRHHLQHALHRRFDEVLLQLLASDIRRASSAAACSSSNVASARYGFTAPAPYAGEQGK